VSPGSPGEPVCLRAARGEGAGGLCRSFRDYYPQLAQLLAMQR
jgi:hypothetical protein